MSGETVVATAVWIGVVAFGGIIIRWFYMDKAARKDSVLSKAMPVAVVGLLATFWMLLVISKKFAG